MPDRHVPHRTFGAGEVWIVPLGHHAGRRHAGTHVPRRALALRVLVPGGAGDDVLNVHAVVDDILEADVGDLRPQGDLVGVLADHTGIVQQQWDPAVERTVHQGLDALG